MEQAKTTIAVQALWLQYRGLMLESARNPVRLDNAAWQVLPPEPVELSEIDGLMVAT